MPLPPNLQGLDQLLNGSYRRKMMGLPPLTGADEGPGPTQQDVLQAQAEQTPNTPTPVPAPPGVTPSPQVQASDQPQAAAAAPPSPGDQYQQMIMGLMAKEKKAEAERKNLLTTYLGQSQQADISPLLGLIDNWTGSKTAQNYKAPQGVSEDAINNLMKLSSEGKNPDLPFLLQGMKQAGTKTRTNDITDRLGVSNVNRLFDKDTNLTKATGILNRVNVDLNTLKDPNLTMQKLTELSTGLNFAMSGANGVGIEATKSVAYTNAQAAINNITNYITSDPEYFKNPKLLAMIKDQFDRLKNSYQQLNRQSAFIISKGLPYHDTDKFPLATEALAAKKKLYHLDMTPEEEDAFSNNLVGELAAPAAAPGAAPAPAGAPMDLNKAFTEWKAKQNAAATPTK